MDQGLKAQIHRYAENREIDYVSAKNLGVAYGIKFQNEKELVEWKQTIDRYLKTFQEKDFNKIEEAVDGPDSKNGLKKDFWPNGEVKAEYTLVNGQLDGEYKEFDNSGKLFKKVFYKDGRVVNNAIKENYEAFAVTKSQKKEGGCKSKSKSKGKGKSKSKFRKEDITLDNVFKI